MGAPRFEWDRIPLSRAFEDTRAIDLTHALPDGRVLAGPSVVNVGNPHCIFWVKNADSYDLASFGYALEHHPLFPERANISLAEVVCDAPPLSRRTRLGEFAFFRTGKRVRAGEGVGCGLLTRGRG